MSFDSIFEDFSAEEINNAEEAKVETITKPTMLSTPLFDIHFKKFELGETAVDGGSGLHLQAMLSFADKFIQLFALNVINCKATVCGKELVADDMAPQISAMFNEQGELKGEYRAKLSDSSIRTAENEYARAVAYWQTAQQLVEAWPVLLPNARQEPQLAWKTDERKSITGCSQEALREAARYRMDTSPTLKKIKAVVAQRRKAVDSSNVDNINAISHALGF